MENYQIIKKISDGVHGSVYEALHLKTGLIVALKEYEKHSDHGEMEHCFLMTLADATPHICRVYDLFTDENTPVLVTKLYQRDLFYYCALKQKFSQSIPENFVIKLCEQMLEALTFLDYHGIIHGDIKPPNIVLTKNDDFVLIDFSSAFDEGTEPIYTVTTWPYRPRELILRRQTLTTKIDIWSLGVVALEIVYDTFFHLLFREDESAICVGGCSRTSYCPDCAVHLNFVTRLHKGLEETLEEDVKSPKLRFLLDHMLKLKQEDRPRAQNLKNLVRDAFDYKNDFI